MVTNAAEQGCGLDRVPLIPDQYDHLHISSVAYGELHHKNNASLRQKTSAAKVPIRKTLHHDHV